MSPTVFRGDVEPRTLLVQFLRENLRLTGTHVGCDTSQCGACVVHVNGTSVKSCTTLAVQLEGASVTTIEGLAQNGNLHPMQEAFREHHALQCGFCTPGMILSAVDLVSRSAAGFRPVRWLDSGTDATGNCRRHHARGVGAMGAHRRHGFMTGGFD